MLLVDPHVSARKRKQGEPITIAGEQVSLTRGRVEKARLDADRTAKPKTRIVAHVPPGKGAWPHNIERYELRDNDDDERSHPPTDDDARAAREEMGDD